MIKENKDRLPTDVAPVHYDLVIKTDVEQGTFEGKAIIQTATKLPFPLSTARARPSTLERRPICPKMTDLVLGLPKDQKLLPGDQGVKLSLSWTASLRKDGKGNAYISKLGSGEPIEVVRGVQVGCDGCGDGCEVGEFVVVRGGAVRAGDFPGYNREKYTLETYSGGAVADLFEADERGLGMVIFSAASFMGPALGPIIPERYPIVLLRRRAALLSRVTGKRYVYKGDKGKDVGIVRLYETALNRPWALLFKEPIVFLLAVYMAITIETLYLLFGAFPIVFQQERGWSPGIGGLSFLGVLVGRVLAVVYSLVYENPRYARKLKVCPVLA
ncbi:hypothetical protein QFC20_006505 [Naganishia adeliensis]|uniref:Uncharacterized protein n=1 Tax=Naganishia adeliensis TaxID=92952 RepID=A0ACC2V9T1_9TREE|nr:hypothetical protein QFC20_006505 [Naganishia adeliensis]